MVGADVVDLALAAIGLRVALEMAEEADHLAFEQRRAAAFARPLDDLARRLVDGEEIRAVDGHARQAEARGAVDIAVHGHGIVARGGFGIAVVLDHEDHRQVPDGGEIEAFQEHALVGGAVADEADAHAPSPRNLAASAAPQASGAPAPRMPLAPIMPLERSAICMEPPLPRQEPVALAVDLGHHLLDVDALGDAMAMAAMGGGDAVACRSDAS